MRLSNKNCAGLASKFPRLLKVLAVLLLLAAWAQPYRVVYAQTWPPLTGNGVVADNTGRLDAGQVSDGAQGLRSLGVKPLAVLSQGNLGYAAVHDPLWGWPQGRDGAVARGRSGRGRPEDKLSQP